MQRQPDFADVFERVLVPAIFDRYARDLIERARPFGPSDRVLDLGCGTGIVARLLRERLGGAARITGVDINAQMIAKARSIAPEIDWHEGNAVALPFGECTFDVVLCQQMLQFTSDRAAAVREIARVLAPGGRLIASTWKPRHDQPLWHALGEVAERHLGPANDKRWTLDAPELRSLLSDAGFSDIHFDTVALEEHHRDLPIRTSTLAANHDLDALSAEERERRLSLIEAESASVLAKFAAPAGGYINKSITNIV
ncbi:MAG TPA: class I SAM-dependent methyltransferase, partial [Kofleriaceae bacterium]